MTAARAPSWGRELDVVGVSVGAGLVSGALSTVAPALAGLTGALAALALAGWVALAQQTSGSIRDVLTRSSAGALASVGLGSGIFLAGGASLAPFRGLALGLSLVPLWGVARRGDRGGS